MNLRSSAFIFRTTALLLTLVLADPALAQDNSSGIRDITTVRYKSYNLALNSPASDFGLFPFGPNSFFFSSNRKNEKSNNEKPVLNYNGLPFLDIYMVMKTGDTTYTSPAALPGSAESKYNEGPVYFDVSSNSFYITRNQYDKKKIMQSRHGVNRLKIYIENIDGTSFKAFGQFQHNSNAYSVGHAALTQDGKRIYFSSDMPGGSGGSDIYVCTRQGDQWSAPKNLGPDINTAGNELFPFVSADNKLYYSTNGRNPQTGLDIYCAVMDGEGFKSPTRLGEPFNSDQDDFAFYIYADNRSGYFSSNRSGGKGDDDVYSFSLDNPVIHGLVLDAKGGSPMAAAKIKILDESLKMVELTTDADGKFSYHGQWNSEYTIEARQSGFTPVTKSISASKAKADLSLEFRLVKEEYSLEGIVMNKDNQQPMGGLVVALVTKSTGKLLTVTSDGQGKFSFPVAPNQDYMIQVEKEKFLTANVAISTAGMGVGTKKQNVLMEELKVGKSIKVDNVYYDLGKWDIRPDAKLELDKLVELMRENPGMVIELSSHTDSRGSDASNLSLSDKRAKAVAAYVISKGIAAERVTGKGYGETKLLNSCKNGVKCSDGDHQANRRTEFKILKI